MCLIYSFLLYWSQGAGAFPCGRAGRTLDNCYLITGPTDIDRQTFTLTLINNTHFRFAGSPWDAGLLTVEGQRSARETPQLHGEDVQTPQISVPQERELLSQCSCRWRLDSQTDRDETRKLTVEFLCKRSMAPYCSLFSFHFQSNPTPADFIFFLQILCIQTQTVVLYVCIWVFCMASGVF